MRDRILGSADALGSLASLAAPAVNFANRSRPGALGDGEDASACIGTGFSPPSTARRSRNGGTRRGGEDVRRGARIRRRRRRCSSTCSVNFNNPDIGKAAVAVLEKNGVEVIVPFQKCCGMPFLDSGDLDSARGNRRENLNSLMPFVRRGIPVVTTGPTCSLTLKKEYPLLGKDADADALSQATLDLSEYLMKRHAAGKLETDFPKSAGRIAYHVACHLKVQDIGFKSRDLLALVPGNHIETIEKCSGHDGTWSMKTEYFPMSMEIGKPLFEKIRETSADAVATDCPLAGLQIRQGAGISPRHPIQIFAECYGLEV